jgi:hypothetical protein
MSTSNNSPSPLVGEGWGGGRQGPEKIGSAAIGERNAPYPRLLKSCCWLANWGGRELRILLRLIGRRRDRRLSFSPHVKGGLGVGGWSAIYQPRLFQTGLFPGYQLRNHQSEWVTFDGLFTGTFEEMCLIAH